MQMLLRLKLNEQKPTRSCCAPQLPRRFRQRPSEPKGRCCFHARAPALPAGPVVTHKEHFYTPWSAKGSRRWVCAQGSVPRRFRSDSARFEGFSLVVSPRCRNTGNRRPTTSRPGEAGSCGERSPAGGTPTSVQGGAHDHRGKRQSMGSKLLHFSRNFNLLDRARAYRFYGPIRHSTPGFFRAPSARPGAGSFSGAGSSTPGPVAARLQAFFHMALTVSAASLRPMPSNRPALANRPATPSRTRRRRWPSTSAGFSLRIR